MEVYRILYDFFLSAMQNIDASVYEAAKMDGCNFRQTFFKITMPLLKPIIFLTGIMALNNTLQLFDEVVNLTNGGPVMQREQYPNIYMIYPLFMCRVMDMQRLFLMLY